MKHNSGTTPPIGGSSLMVIFAVLCLTVFALLSLSTVEADARLSQKNADHVSSYYAAEVEAEEILAALRRGTIPEGVQVSENVYSYSTKISDNRELSVKVQLDGSEYTILQWQSVYSSEWVPDDSIDVWDGEINNTETKREVS